VENSAGHQAARAWMEIDEARSLLQQVEACPRRWRAGRLGQELNFTGADWRVLRLRTIAPIDKEPLVVLRMSLAAEIARRMV
jgi:hypothetical protein